MNDSLEHHGILGMRWGVRRTDAQLRNGSSSRTKSKPKKASSLSDEELSNSVRRMNLEKQYSKMSKENAGPSKIESTKKAVDSASTLVNQTKKLSNSSSPKKPRMNLDKMTDQQLREKINRENLERQYNDMFAPPETVSRGKRYLSNTLEVAGSILVIGSSALGIALAIKELKG